MSGLDLKHVDMNLEYTLSSNWLMLYDRHLANIRNLSVKQYMASYSCGVKAA